MRICSFLPSATEILFELGLGDSVAGITYECDYPPDARTKKVVVRTRLPQASSAAETDRLVSESLARGESLYRIDIEALAGIRPDLIVTQDLCRVCAASPGDLASSIESLAHVPKVISLNPRTLADIWKDVLTVGEATGRGARAKELVAELERRVTAVVQAVAAEPNRPRVLCLEWLDPPFVGGHWVPEMVNLAGGIDVLGRVGEPSFRVDWQKAIASEPDVVVVMPCGYGLEQTVKEFRGMRFLPGWQDLAAVRNGQVFAVDATSYFSRPGPRLAEGVEILANILHPTRTPVAPPDGAVARLV
jgi:iron complex transport system substrate-binding protein